MAVVNVMEEIVKERLDILLAETNCCKCERCKGDMMALALNMVQPKYANSLKGKLFSKMDSKKSQNAVDIDIAIAKAIATVSSDPHRP